MKCGRNLLQTFFEYYQNTGVIAVDIPSEILKKPQKNRNDRKKRKRSRYCKNTWTSRSQAPVHFQTLNMNYDSETSVEDQVCTFRNASSRQTVNKRRDLNQAHVSSYRESENTYLNSSQAKTFVVHPPSISIIDFNIISRNDVERFNALNKVKL